MPTMDDLYTALRNADAAGDTAAAQKLATHIKTMRAAPAPAAPPETSFFEDIKQGAGNLAAGAVRGAGSIGSTLMAAHEASTPGGVFSAYFNDQNRRTQMDQGMKEMGADPDSWMYKGGKLSTEIAGTSGAGGVLAQGAARAGLAPRVVQALGSGGLRAGGATGVAGMGLRTGAGATTGAASAGMVEPENAGMGALFGGALPGAVKVTGALGSRIASGVNGAAARLMQSAIKPTIAQLKSGDAATAVEMMLKYGINPTAGGVGKLRGLVDDLNNQIGDSIANSGAKIDKSKVLDRLSDVRTKFSNQVSPTSDLNAIRSAGDDFMGHPGFPGAQIPVAGAQALKQGTYRVLAKKYGQMGNADVEAQKALARGLKDEIAEAVPGISALNREESKLLATLSVAERRALMEMNKNPMGLAALAHSPASWAMFMADKSALFKSLAARSLNSSTQGARRVAPQLESAMGNPLLRNAVTLPRFDE